MHSFSVIRRRIKDRVSEDDGWKETNDANVPGLKDAVVVGGSYYLSGARTFAE